MRAAVIAGVVACGNDLTEPVDSLVGTWDLIGFTDGGVAAAVTGTFTFRTDGTYSARATVTFPDELPDVVVTAGTFQQAGTVVTLTSDGEQSTWDATFTGDQVVLTEREPPPANTITLRRS